MKVLKEFKAVVNSNKYDYKLIEKGSEYILRSYKHGRMQGSITWDNKAIELGELLACCNEMEDTTMVRLVA